MCLRSNAPRVSSSRMAMSARSLVVALVSRPTNTRIGGLAGPPITASISSTVSAMLTNRRPSRPIVSNGTALRGPALTNSEVGAIEYAASTASPVVSAEANTCCRPLNPANPSSPNATACPTGRPISSRSRVHRGQRRTHPTGEQPLAPGRHVERRRDAGADAHGLADRDALGVVEGLTLGVVGDALLDHLRAQPVVLPRRQARTQRKRDRARCASRSARSPPMPSNSMSPVTMIAPAIPPTASRQLNVRPHARAIGSSLRWARNRCAATPMPIAATSPARITPALGHPPLRGVRPPARPP